MAGNLKEVANLAWLQIGGGTDESRVTLEEVIATARYEYAWQMLQLAWRERREEGTFYIPSYLAKEVELPIVNNQIDISKEPIMKGLPDERWLVNVGGIGCACEYVKSNINNAQVLCDDDSLGDMVKTYVVIGDKIVFPKGAHGSKLTIIYAHNGSSLDENEITIDDSIGGIVRQRLVEIYLGKTTPEDRTNNSNANN